MPLTEFAAAADWQSGHFCSRMESRSYVGEAYHYGLIDQLVSQVYYLAQDASSVSDQIFSD